MRIDRFDYDLPPELIAQEPLPARDASRLLVLPRSSGAPRHAGFGDLPDLLAPGDLLVVNRTRVVPARLVGTRRGGGAAEVLLVRPVGPDEWEALVRPGRRLRPGDEVAIAEDLVVRVLTGSITTQGSRRVRLHPAPGLDAAAALERHGRTPLPPYIRRAAGPVDRDRYQTVYARDRGSVAAPTAGLHFTPELLGRIQERGVERAEVVLHVGPGTFKPVQVDDVSTHRVDPEPLRVPAATAEAVARTRIRGGRVVAVGTTTARALESAAVDDGTIVPVEGVTDLVIVPGFTFRVVDALLTNFHLPRSSLLLLVAAFAGRERVLSAYAEAVHQRYRFYSYGDAMLVL
jgi:S-adenosylmethionine:tRNA ribosyltransferase-isomerase